MHPKPKKLGNWIDHDHKCSYQPVLSIKVYTKRWQVLQTCGWVDPYVCLKQHSLLANGHLSLLSMSLIYAHSICLSHDGDLHYHVCDHFPISSIQRFSLPIFGWCLYSLSSSKVEHSSNNSSSVTNTFPKGTLSRQTGWWMSWSSWPSMLPLLDITWTIDGSKMEVNCIKNQHFPRLLSVEAQVVSLPVEWVYAKMGWGWRLSKITIFGQKITLLEHILNPWCKGNALVEVIQKPHAK